VGASPHEKMGPAPTKGRERNMGKGQKKQKTSGKLGWRSKKANHGRKPGMGRGKRN